MAASLLRFRTSLVPFSLMTNFLEISRLPFSTASASPSKRVGVHNGTFHCDEALGCFMISLTSKFHGARIIRTRNLEHYGVEIIAKEIQMDEGHPDVHSLFLAVYKNFVEAVDAIDNGINQYETDQPPRYVNNTTLSSRISRLNMNWYDTDQSSEKEDQAFQHAMALAGSEFINCIHFHAKSWLPARSVVMECLAARKDIDPSGEIMLLTKSCPWKFHIFDLEVELKIDPLLKYVIYQDDRNSKWRVQAVAVSPDKFESRKPLPSHWRGLTDDHLSEVAGISGCVFVHTSGFIGGNKTYEGVLAMARASLLA
ncbi:UPF0160 protein MYG1, mitochondrial-like isoform X2 [Cynara cardunculus var. scolymus]|uniref:UPF0160 protein MYG1, mitochondrial-like isoform X2 n=1 Tax=Cynara cardunculus var. scolymus TaxID=59895 RepID=UPI000D622F5C|nr:UPF0160 protein MYG1, mitochondrial-like isoform X2 [Cynara cardunculus var. scolymus]